MNNPTTDGIDVARRLRDWAHVCERDNRAWDAHLLARAALLIEFLARGTPEPAPAPDLCRNPIEGSIRCTRERNHVGMCWNNGAPVGRQPAEPATAGDYECPCTTGGKCLGCIGGPAGSSGEPAAQVDEGKLWVFLRDVLSQGMAIQRDIEHYRSHEQLSAHLDHRARDRAAEFPDRCYAPTKRDES